MTLLDAEEEEVAQKSHGRHHAEVRFAVVGEDGQEKNGVGMKMQRVQPVVAKDLVEEVREGGTNPSAIALMKKGKKVLPSGSGTSEPTQSLVFPLSLLSPAVSKHMVARFFSEMLGALRPSSYQADDEVGWTLRGTIGR